MQLCNAGFRTARQPVFSENHQIKDFTMDTTSSMNNGQNQARGLNPDTDKRAELHGAIDKAANSAQPAVERMATSVHAGVDKVSDTIAGVSGSITDGTRQVSDAYQRYAETGRDYVRSNPATSLLVALAAGYGLSKILGARRNKRQ
jgi:ElaB/YqjD/DUF883 family membrane-anchored ribosome-binding protein